MSWTEDLDAVDQARQEQYRRAEDYIASVDEVIRRNLLAVATHAWGERVSVYSGWDSVNSYSWWVSMPWGHRDQSDTDYALGLRPEYCVTLSFHGFPGRDSNSMNERWRIVTFIDTDGGEPGRPWQFWIGSRQIDAKDLEEHTLQEALKHYYAKGPSGDGTTQHKLRELEARRNRPRFPWER